MDAAYLSALSALAGSVIGGLTSLATTWFTQHGQEKLTVQTQERVKREALFSQFIDESAALYADALTHNSTDLSKLSALYAMISRMRLLSSQNIVAHAESVSHLVIDTYIAPNRTFEEIRDLRKSGVLDPLKEFADACREELHKYR